MPFDNEDLFDVPTEQQRKLLLDSFSSLVLREEQLTLALKLVAVEIAKGMTLESAVASVAKRTTVWPPELFSRARELTQRARQDLL